MEPHSSSVANWVALPGRLGLEQNRVEKVGEEVGGNWPEDFLIVVVGMHCDCVFTADTRLLNKSEML